MDLILQLHMRSGEEFLTKYVPLMMEIRSLTAKEQRKQLIWFEVIVKESQAAHYKRGISKLFLASLEVDNSLD